MARWDVKHVLGEVDVERGRQRYFEVPARNAVYFQLLDRERAMRADNAELDDGAARRTGRRAWDATKTNSQRVPAAKSAGLALSKPAQKLQPLAGQPPHPLLARLEKEGSAGECP